MPVRTALVEDNATFRRQLAERLNYFDGVELMFAVANGTAFLDKMAALAPAVRPQVVLMDIEMPGLSGIETTGRLKEAWPDVDVIMLTVLANEATIFEAIQAGASGYLLKDATGREIVDAVQEMAAGGAPMSPRVARKMLEHVRATTGGTPTTPDPPAETFALTPRELDVLHFLVDAKTEEDIAETLHISPHTVRTHIKHIYKKMHVHSRAGMVRLALTHRLVDLSKRR